jgi:hypothetical protein
MMGEDGEHRHLLFWGRSQYSITPSLRLNGVEDADEAQPSLAASERIP